MGDERRIYATPPTLQRFFAGRRSERVERSKKQSTAVEGSQHSATSAYLANTNLADVSNSRSWLAGDLASPNAEMSDPTGKDKWTKRRPSSPYRITDTPRYVMAGLADLVGKARSPSVGRRNREKSGQKLGTNSLPPGLSSASPSIQAQDCVSTPPTPTSPRDRSLAYNARATSASPRKDSPHPSELPIPTRRVLDLSVQKRKSWNFEETVVGCRPADLCNAQNQVPFSSGRSAQQLASVSPIIRVQYSDESISSLKDLSPDGRNLLNKKEPPTTIKEASESVATIDDQEADKASKTLSHENTVVRVDTSNTKPPQTPQQQKAAVCDNLNSSRAASLPVQMLAATSSPRRTPSAVMKKPMNVNNTALSQKKEIVCVTQQLLDSISCKDYDTYSKLCDAGMTCFEPESMGNLIEGMDFHKFYFDNVATSRVSKIHTTMLNPSVHLLGDDGACIAYIRLTQYIDRNGEARSRQSEETRVWQKRNGRGWVCVHVHRTGAPSSVNTASQD